MDLMKFGWGTVLEGAVLLAILGYFILRLWRKRTSHRKYSRARNGAAFFGGWGPFRGSDDSCHGMTDFHDGGGTMGCDSGGSDGGSAGCSELRLWSGLP